jgi:hypothetical protein
MDDMEKGTLESLALIGTPDEPPDVTMAREELKSLHVQRQRLDQEKLRFERELVECRTKSGEFQREVGYLSRLIHH